MISSAAQKLPSDIIREIFGYFSTSLVRAHASKQFPWSLGHVCSTWRATFLTMTTEFWQSISIDYCYRSPDTHHIHRIVEMTKFFVTRNQEERISFHYRILLGSQDRLKFSNLRSVLDVLVEESMRWESVSIEPVPEDLVTLRTVKGRLPSLRSLTLSTVPGRHSSNDQLDIFEHAPSLQEVALVEDFNWKLKWSSLTTLKLFGAHFVQNEFSILSQALNVETLVIGHVTWGVMGSDDPVPLAIRLPHLKRFSLLGGARFLTILEAPMLHEMRLEFHIHRDLPSVTSFLSRSSCRIQRLTIGSTTQSALAQILRRTPEIEHLELHGQRELIHCLEALDASPLIPTSREGKLARRLKSLTVATSAYRTSNSPFTPQELDQLMKLIKSRNGLEGSTEGHVERLETLTALLLLVQERPRSLAELEIFCRDMGVTFRCHLGALP